MHEALCLARRGRGWVSPNPVVGAVVVSAGRIVGRGWHKAFGGPHAEVSALQEAGELARGATLYCALEPCSHTGKTPPCVQAVTRAGIATVVLGAPDPNPLAAGGADALRAAGVAVVTGVCEDECRALNAPFFKHVATGLPLVSVKWAMSADGKIANARGDSKWITSDEARAWAHRLRAQHDAVLVGIGTLLKDAPLLTCRLDVPVRQPRRVVLDARARTPLDAPLWAAPNGGPVVIACGTDAAAERVAALRAGGADVIQCGAEGGRLPLRPVLTALAERGVLSVLAEGGSEVLGSVLDGNLADMAYVFIAPKVVGGSGSVPAVGGRGVNCVADALALRAVRVRTVGQDVLLSGVFGAWEYEREPL